MIKFDYKEYQKDGGAKKKSFEMPPAGADVIAIIRKDGTEEKTSAKGNKYWQVKMEIIGDVGTGYYLYYSIPEGEYQMSFLGRLLEATGIDIKKVKNVDILKLVGKKVRVRIKHEMRGGSTKAVINYFLAYNSSIEGMSAPEPAVVENTESSNDATKEAGSDDMPF